MFLIQNGFARKLGHMLKKKFVWFEGLGPFLVYRSGAINQKIWRACGFLRFEVYALGAIH